MQNWMRVWAFGLSIVLAVPALAATRKLTDAEVVGAIAQNARLSVTFADFVNTNVKTPAVRASLIEKLKSLDAWETRLPEIYSTGDGFSLDIGPEPETLLHFVSQPKPHLVFNHRVIETQGRTVTDVAKDLSAAYAAYLNGSRAALRLVLGEPAIADSTSTKLIAGSVAGVVASDSFQNPELADDATAIRAAQAKQKFTVQCTSPDRPGVVQPKVTFASLPFFGTWMVKNYKSESTFDLDNLYGDAPSMSDCHFHFKEPDTITRQPMTCGAGTMKESKGSAAKALQRLLPQVPLAQIAHCCSSNAAECEKKMAMSGATAPAASGGVAH